MTFLRGRWWQFILPTTFALFPIVASRRRPVANTSAIRQHLDFVFKPKWLTRRFVNLHQQIAEYSTTVAQNACKAEKVTQAFSELLEDAIEQPNVTRAIERKLDHILASPGTQKKLSSFFTNLLGSEEIKKALHDQLADEDLQQRISDSFIFSLKRLLPWSSFAQQRAESKRAEALKVRGDRTQ